MIADFLQNLIKLAGDPPVFTKVILRQLGMLQGRPFEGYRLPLGVTGARPATIRMPDSINPFLGAAAADAFVADILRAACTGTDDRVSHHAIAVRAERFHIDRERLPRRETHIE